MRSRCLALLVLALAACDAGAPDRPDLPDVPLEEAWALDYTHAGAPKVVPLVVGDSVVVATAGLDLVAIRLATGDVKWRTAATTDFTLQSQSVVTDGERLYTFHRTALEENYRAYDLETGVEVWRRDVGDGEVVSTSVLANHAAHAGVFYAGDNRGYVYAFDGATGALRWRYKSDEVTTAGIAYADGALYLGQGVIRGGEKGAVTKLDAATGDVLWSFRNPSAGPLWLTPVVDGPAVVAFGDSLRRIDRATGAELLAAPAVGDSEPAAVEGPWAYGSTTDLWKQNLRTGEIAWVRYYGGGTNDVVLGGRLYHSTWGGVVVVDPATGAVLHEEPGPGWNTWSIAAGGGLVIAQSTGRITAYRPGRIEGAP